MGVRGSTEVKNFVKRKRKKKRKRKEKKKRKKEGKEGREGKEGKERRHTHTHTLPLFLSISYICVCAHAFYIFMLLNYIAPQKNTKLLKKQKSKNPNNYIKLIMLKVLYGVLYASSSVTLCVHTQSCSLAETGESFVRECLHARVVHPH